MMSPRPFVSALLVLPLLCNSPLLSAEAPKKETGLETRVPWTASRVKGTPEPPDPYTLVRAFPHLHFDRSLDMQPQPGTHKLFVCEESGMIYSIDDDEKCDRAEPFLDLRRKDDRYLPWDQHRRLWSIVFHPKYQQNGYVYASYMEQTPAPHRCRISRFQVDMKYPQNPPKCDPDTETIVFEWVSSVDHHGGCLKFGPDGMLYCSAGDGAALGDGHISGQDISDINASVIRIDVDHPKPGWMYSIPKDNPFVDMPGARGEVYAFGLRNVWKMSFDRATGDLWGGDVGQDLWDMIYRIEKGGNYGWSIREGTHPFRPERSKGPGPILDPVVEHDHSEARSLTGGFVYRGTLHKELIGKYIYGDYCTGKLWSVLFDREHKKVLEHRELAYTPVHITGFCEQNDGELLIVDYQGQLYKLEAVAPLDALTVAAFPRLLSQTGIFESTRENKIAAGVIPYSVNSPLWSDGAVKERFLALPNNQKMDYNPDGTWGFSDGAVLVKTFAMEMEKGDPASVKRLETRLLHYEQDHWRGYTYVWNDDQTDAKLLEGKAGLDKKLEIKDGSAPGGKREQVWHFPGRSECTLCHTMPANYVLGLNTAQMNKDQNYNGVAANQIATLERIGMFKRPVASYYKKDEATGLIKKWNKLADPHDADAPLDGRARAYLQANCAHCHMKWGGGNADFELQWWMAITLTKTLDVKPAHGEWGLTDPRLIAPGDPSRSLMSHRMKLLNEGRMPRLASTVVDGDGVKLIEEWISKMK